MKKNTLEQALNVYAIEKECIEGDLWELISEEEYNRRKSSPNNAFKELENFFDEEE